MQRLSVQAAGSAGAADGGATYHRSDPATARLVTVPGVLNRRSTRRRAGSSATSRLPETSHSPSPVPKGEVDSFGVLAEASTWPLAGSSRWIVPASTRYRLLSATTQLVPAVSAATVWKWDRRRA